MSTPIKILSFKEWKDNSEYLIDQWFIERKIEIEQWFIESLPDFIFDYFEWNDTSVATEEYIGCLFFNEPNINYSMNLIISANSLSEGVILEVNLKLTGYLKEDDTMLGVINKTLSSSEIKSDLIIELVNEFKINFLNSENNNLTTEPSSEIEDNT